VGADDLVLDLGAGTGRLTRELAAVARRVVAVELDPRLAHRLAGRWANVDVLEADATAIALPREPFRVVANIPFDRTGELLRLLLDDATTPLVRADLVVEWGAAVKRALPWPSSVANAVWGAFYEPSLARRLPRSSFSPAPAVDAGVLVLRRREEPLVPLAEARAYRAFVARGFRHGLRSVVPRSIRAEAAGALPRDLDAPAWAALFARSTSRKR
jgi:23S rRNA (adenine-N6)-dimethyltransferase